MAENQGVKLNLISKSLDPSTAALLPTDGAIIQSVEEIRRRRELARDIANKKARLKKKEKDILERENIGLKPGETAHQQESRRQLEAARQKLSAMNAAENSAKTEFDRALERTVVVDDPTETEPVTYEPTPIEPDAIIGLPDSTAVPAQAQRVISKKELALMQGTSRPEIARLMEALNLNVNVQLSKNDTSNLLACLLTCNEAQLDALYTNKKIPVAIKIIIKRILEDVKNGSTDTVERLWEKLFGKTGLNTPEAAAANGSAGEALSTLIPDGPISREAYAILHQTLICKR